MRLHVTHHAFQRMAEWHPEFKQFVPRGDLLDDRGALGVMNGLHIFVASLESGRPSTVVERVVEYRQQKYQKYRPVYIFDRALSDFYQMQLDQRGLVLLTVTYLHSGQEKTVLDEPRPMVSFDDVTEITVPYALKPDVDLSNCSFLQTPAGRYIDIHFGIPTKRPWPKGFKT